VGLGSELPGKGCWFESQACAERFPCVCGQTSSGCGRVCRGYLIILGSIPNGAGTDGVVVLLSFLLHAPAGGTPDNLDLS